MTKVLKGMILAGFVAGAAGCVSSGDLEEVRAMAQEAQSTAQSAESTANSAESTAENAQQTADRAMKAAQEAKDCCEANSKRIERMFEKSQRK